MSSGSAAATTSYGGASRGFSYGGKGPRYVAPGVMKVAGVVLVGMLVVLFWWTLQMMYLRWTNTTGYYSHGPLVFPIAVASAWLIVRRRGLPVESTRWSRVIGLLLLVAALVVHLAMVFARVTFISAFMIQGMMAGMVLYLGGWVMLRRLWFPIAFLFFMVPLPDIMIYNINFHLKMYAAQMSTTLVNVLGVPVFTRGSEVFLTGDKKLTVDDVCSGLRSLISLLAFSMLFTYACRLRGYKRLVLFLSAVPIALLANVVRITILVLAAHWWGVRWSVPGGWLHDSMGFVIFIIAFCLMFLEEELLGLLPGGKAWRWRPESEGSSDGVTKGEAK